ncbi:hypothetical protein Rhe02_20190 [Rhizocola hellebori]|uniref:Uncharacterized protein n=1 Tax=Rhizocola hellebori TaxID=1392758 RepID=A0A8J3Q626_9ACTN|nr:DUF6069 family protein [Rhizocola hellebori]GIH03952.1 hypothetical protein Rhe02_20190 [Rhizocola hellebori]
MTDTEIEPATTPTTAGRLAVVSAALTGLLIANLAIYAAGRAFGGTFVYLQNATPVEVGPLAITIMSLVPLATGLAVIAALSRLWPAAIRVARIAGPTLAVATIGLMTVPAGFDTTSAVSLAVMHLTTIPATLIALNALARQ